MLVSADTLPFLAEFDVKAKKARVAAAQQKERYWKLRMEVIAFLGGKCSCGCTDITVLEIHHVNPTLKGGYKQCTGWQIMKEWKMILEGKVEAKLRCHDCHINGEHHGNPCELKKVKKEMEQ